MKTSRQRILDYIRQKRRVTSQEISLAFQMSPANARHHLAILEEQGLVSAVDQKIKPGKGRPVRLFQLSYQISGQNFEILASALLQAIQDRREDPDQCPSLAAISAAMSNRIGEPEIQHDNLGKSLSTKTARLNGTIKALNHHHYQSHWEARSGNPQILLGNCPYLPLVKDHPELCALDTQILENLLQTQVKMIQRMSFDSTGIQLCRFEIS